MSICFSTLACPDWSWETVMRRAAEMGYDGVEVRLIEQQVDLRQVPALARDEWPRRREELTRLNVQVPVLSSSIRFDYPDDAARREQIDIGRDYIDLAVGLGARMIRVFGDVLSQGAPALDKQQVFGNIVDGLKQLGAIAGDHGIDIVVETHGDFAESRLIERLMHEVDHPRVGLLWDTHHPWRFFHEDLAMTVQKLAPWLKHTHWKDSVLRPTIEKDAAGLEADARARDLMSGHKPADYVLFGGGEFPAFECAELLRHVGYKGWYSLEWEKAWHPEIDPPEIALPLFPTKMRRLMTL